jgi:hypothetical protein
MDNPKRPADHDRRQTKEGVTWPPLHDGANEPGPTDMIGEYRAREQPAPGESNAGLAGMPHGARVPGDVRPYEQPLDVASESVGLPDSPADSSQAERAVGDQRHLARGKPSMSSTEGSS